MRLYVLRSSRVLGGEISPSQYGAKFIQNLTNDPNLCLGCGASCIRCRDTYDIDFSSEIAGAHELPTDLPQMIDDPAKYLPEIPPHEVMVAINVHEDLLLELPKMAVKAGAKALVVPVEDPRWVSMGVRNQLHRICDELQMEFSAPKPFCSLGEVGKTNIDSFVNKFRIGRPKLVIKIQDNKIANVQVLRSAPCGDTYYVARKMIGLKIDEKLDETVSKFWHSYPCIGSMKLDPELKDTILHTGGYLHRTAVHDAIKAATGDDAEILHILAHQRTTRIKDAPGSS